MIECDTDSDTDADEMIADGNVPIAVKPVAVFIEANFNDKPTIKHHIDSVRLEQQTKQKQNRTIYNPK
ncbi:hypothetical protein DERP_005421 [Dermatophagoides pteronyssinus]|uniref:Uncharacterized protein n=1 Tax=Dermatophagoides pteronyssinus TaxID=6956 RepID=A0ABQ8JMS2_DERPT|nr:hypothetical protein DERP_005421 [Dermatophagoides pteronyssinus]